MTKESGNECEKAGTTSGKDGHDKRTRGRWQQGIENKIK